MQGNYPLKMQATSSLLRRAKPLLGTLVEVACDAHDIDTDAALHASEQAFAAVARVQCLMSRHEISSELSDINRLAPGVWLDSSTATLEVLCFAQTLSEHTAGVFDVFSTIPQAPVGGSWRDLELDVPNQRLCKFAPLQADLGGIAKGYAVDIAVLALQSAGVVGGWANAGGDLRVFGTLTLPLQVRAPWNIADRLDCTDLCDQSAATSASYWLEAPLLRHGVTQKPANALASYTVVADKCIAADALTKVLAATHDAQTEAPRRMFAALLDHYKAQAWVLPGLPNELPDHV